MKNNRLPIVILAALVLIALIYRLFNPPQPPTPGPRGMLPTWISMSKVGDMGSWQVNESGKMWAGAWNVQDKDKARSAVWVIDLEALKAEPYKLEGKSVKSLNWASDKTIEVTTDNDEAMAIDTTGGKISKSASNKENAASIVSIVDKKSGGKQTFYLAGDDNKLLFRSDDLPGKIEGIWYSPEGALIVCSERDKFDRVVYDIASGKLKELKKGEKIDPAAYADAPKDMLFVSYTAGYNFNLNNGKIKKLFSFENLRRSDDAWRREVQGGRLYPRKDGSYTSVSFAAGAIDIRTINKDGTKGKDILPRM